MPFIRVSLVGVSGSGGGGFNPVLITTVSLPAATVGVPYGPVTMSVTGGFPPYIWSISAGSLPTGLSISSDGVISGTPTVASSFSFTIFVLDGVGQSDSAGGTI